MQQKYLLNSHIEMKPWWTINCFIFLTCPGHLGLWFVHLCSKIVRHQHIVFATYDAKQCVYKHVEKKVKITVMTPKMVFHSREMLYWFNRTVGNFPAIRSIFGSDWNCGNYSNYDMTTSLSCIITLETYMVTYDSQTSFNLNSAK